MPPKTPIAPELAKFGLVDDMVHRCWAFPHDVILRSGGKRIHGVVLRELSVEDSYKAAASINTSAAGMNMMEFSVRQQTEDLKVALVAFALEPIPWKPTHGPDPDWDPDAEDSPAAAPIVVVGEEPDFSLAKWTRVPQPFPDSSTWSVTLHNLLLELNQSLNGLPSGAMGKIRAAGAEWSASGTAPSTRGPAGGVTGGRSRPPGG
jgi:hypothetical protein